MKLTVEQILARIKSPRNKGAIDLACYQEERLIMHCEPILEKYNLPFNAYRNFTLWWQSLITEEKYKRIDELIGTPLSTQVVTRDIFNQINKFADAQDRFVDFKFTNPDYTLDYMDYLCESNDDIFWTQKCLDALRTEICSMVVVDLPTSQDSLRPEPYKYFVSPRQFIDTEINKFAGNVEYLIFKQDDFIWDIGFQTPGVNSKFGLLKDGQQMQKLIALDDEFYRVFISVKGKETWQLWFEIPHNLGYCPCIDFWQPSEKGSNGLNKIGPVTIVLRKLDYLLFYQALVDYMDLYGPFPVMVMYDMGEEEFDDKTKEINSGDYYTIEQTSPVSNVPQTQNPRKAIRRVVGAGTVIEVPVPADKNDHNFMDNPMKFITMDVESIKAVHERIDSLKNEIIEICTGEDSEYLNEIAKNSEMLSASYSEKETIISWVKRQVERVHRFCTKTQAELRYGKEYFVSCTVDYGSDYFLKDSTALANEFGKAVESGMPQGYCLEIVRAAANTRFKNNADVADRCKILIDLEPYPTMTWEQIQALGINTSDIEGFKIKANFVNFIARFEMECGASVVRFGSAIDYNEKINIIKTKLKEYASGIKWTEPSAGSTQGNGGQKP